MACKTFPTLSIERSNSMYFVKLSDTRGVNLDHVVQWYDLPEGLYPASLVLVTTAPSQHETGAREPYEIRLEGDEREAMLHWLAQADSHQDWKTAYEETREE